MRVQHGNTAAITAVKEDYQEETANEDEETFFRHPAQSGDGAGADAGTVTLLSKECVDASKYDSNGQSNTYSGSTVETAVNNYYTNSISSNVKSAIVDSKMFLLTTDQANTIEQANPEVLKCNKASGAEDNAWWLRSAGYNVEFAPCVFGEYGIVYVTGFTVI